ncbi:MAG: hypothetical protein QOE22_260 [Candidatus Parcubacteria bacterium]|jgi:hypothetical protein|nr:hypothetical protein [Candidatus Parcubacteria bacterium]
MRNVSRKTAAKIVTLFFALLILGAAPLNVFAQDRPAAPAPAAPVPPAGQPTPAPTSGSVDDARSISELPPEMITNCGGTPGAQTYSQEVRDCLVRTIAARGSTGERISNLVGGVAGAVGGIINCTVQLPSCLLSIVSYAILQFANLLLALAGTLFNWVIMKTVFQFATFLGNAPGLLAAWGILRDIGNMMLLFGFIFIGLSTILDLQTYAAKKALPRLIIFAILMNFSLFAAEAVIDTSNVLSVVMYRQANTDPDCVYNAAATGAGSSETAVGNLRSSNNCFINNGIAGRVMQTTGASGIFQTPNGSYTYENAAVMLMLAAFATIAAIVLFAGAIMLVIRAVTLSLLMVSAPLGFAGMAIPPLKKMGEDWWNRLLHQSFFAPIYILLIFVGLKISDAFSGGSGASLAAALQQPDPSVMGILLVFALSIAFFVAALMAAKKFGAAGAGFAVKTATGITAGSFAFAGRRTVGRAAAAGAAKVRSSRFGQTELGRLTAGGLDRGAKAGFDFRNTKAAAAAGKQVGDLGKGQTGGYKKTLDDAAKARTDYAKSLRQTKKDKEKEAELNTQKELVENSKEAENEVWEGQKEEMEKGIQTKTGENQTRQQQRDQERASQLAKVAAAAAAKAAAPTGDLIADSAVRRSLEQAEAAEQKILDDLVAQHAVDAAKDQQEVATLRGDLSTREKEHKENIKGFDNKIKEIDLQINGGVDKKTGEIIVGVGANSAKQRYATNLGSSRRRTLSAAGNARHSAYAAIVKDLKKTKEERIGDEIKEAIQGMGHDVHDIEQKAEEALGRPGSDTREGEHG